jgi:hypothetical protein
MILKTADGLTRNWHISTDVTSIKSLVPQPLLCYDMPNKDGFGGLESSAAALCCNSPVYHVLLNSKDIGSHHINTDFQLQC